jgi:hypothetical protein
MIRLEALLPESTSHTSHTRLLSVVPVPSRELIQKILHPPAASGLNILRNFERQPFLFYLLVDGLNFCFWNPDRNKKFRFKTQSGSVALGYALLRAMKKHPSFFTGQFLSQCAPAAYAAIQEGTAGELLMPIERIAVLREIGSFLERHDLDKKIASFRGADVNRVATFFGKELPYTFGDLAKVRSGKISFYKKLRLFIDDAERLGGARFKGREKLLVYADYRIPQTLIYFGMIRLSPKLEHILRSNTPIPSGSSAEIAIRAASVAASEILQRATRLSYPELDFRLWRLSKTLPKTAIPHHRTPGRFY